MTTNLAYTYEPMSFGQDITLPEKSIKAYKSIVANSNSPSKDWVFTQKGEFLAVPGNFVQVLTVGPRGWNDTNLRVNEKGELARTRHTDPTYRIDAPWWDAVNSVWLDGYYRVWPSAPLGTWFNEVWPKAALTIRTNNSTLFIDVSNSPSESVVVFGHNNDITLKVKSGEQSRLMQTRAAVVINGDSNYIRGYAEHPMTAVYVRGNTNHFVDFIASASEVGYDVGTIYIQGVGYNGTTFTNTQAIAKDRRYAAQHLVAGFYIDDKHSNTISNKCWAHGYMYGVFSHGGNNQRIDHFHSVSNVTDIKFAPHVSSPLIMPTNNVVTNEVCVS